MCEHVESILFLHSHFSILKELHDSGLLWVCLFRDIKTSGQGEGEDRILYVSVKSQDAEDGTDTCICRPQVSATQCCVIALRVLKYLVKVL